MSVEVFVPQFLQHLTDNVKAIETDCDTVGECLDELIRRFPELKEMLYDREGQLPDLLNVYINKKSAYPDGLTRPLNDGDTVHIAYTLVGG